MPRSEFFIEKTNQGKRTHVLGGGPAVDVVCEMPWSLRRRRDRGNDVESIQSLGRPKSLTGIWAFAAFARILVVASTLKEVCEH